MYPVRRRPRWWWGDEMRADRAAKGGKSRLRRHQTDREGPPPLLALPLRPLLLPRLLPSSAATPSYPPPHVSSPCILILPIIPTSQFGQPFASLAHPPLLPLLSTPPPPPGRAKGNRNKQGKEEARGGDDDSRLSPISIGLSFQPRLLIGILSRGYKKRTGAILSLLTRGGRRRSERVSEW